MQEIIKSILSIDKRAIQKEEACRAYLESLEEQKQSKISQLKVKYETKLSQELIDYRQRLDKEIEIESDNILKDAMQQKESLKDKFDRFENTVVEDSFRMILRNLEG